jgi:hypothetical protein
MNLVDALKAYLAAARAREDAIKVVGEARRRLLEVATAEGYPIKTVNSAEILRILNKLEVVWK